MAENTKITGREMLMGRRGFITLTGFGAAAAFLTARPSLFWNGAAVRAGSSGLSKFTEQLPVPPTIDKRAGGSLELPMAAAPPSAMHKFHGSLPATPSWGYGGAAYLGPTIEVRRGFPLMVNAINNLGAHPLDYAVDTDLHGAVEADRTMPRVSLHLHGGNTPPDSDGNPEHTFLPGASRIYNYPNNQEATTLWYHDHALGITRLNVFAGLAGFYLLRDEYDTGRADNTIGLPYGQYEIPIVIQDRSFKADGSFDYPIDDFRGEWVPEFFGDVAVVNGKAFPNLDVDRGIYRFRFLNGSNARVYNLFLSEGHTMYQIGGDGGLLDAPVQLRSLTLAPGERADLLIDFTSLAPGTRIVMKNTAPVPFPNGPRSERRGGVPLPEIMQFTVGSDIGFMGPIPASLRAFPIEPLPEPVAVRNLALIEILDEETGEPIRALLNNLPYETTELEEPVVDTVEQWNIINTTGDAHPIHLHLVQFQVIGRQKFRAEAYIKEYYSDIGEGGQGPRNRSAAEFAIGRMKPPAANEMGWKDTVRANPGEITTIMVPFGANVGSRVPIGLSFTGDYVWHCHILEHEDNEMMLPYRVVPA